MWEGAGDWGSGLEVVWLCWEVCYCLPFLLTDCPASTHSIVMVIARVCTACVGFITVGVICTEATRGVFGGFLVAAALAAGIVA